LGTGQSLKSAMYGTLTRYGAPFQAASIILLKSPCLINKPIYAVNYCWCVS